MRAFFQFHFKPPKTSHLGLTIRALLIFLILCQCTYADSGDILTVRYPASDHIQTYNKRVNYFIEILELGLKKSGKSYRLEKMTTPLLLENRSKNNIKQQLYDIHWMNAKTALEADLTPIPIPLCKGLTGWRILFIRPENQPAFSQMNNLMELNKFTAIHGHDWPEKYMYENNHLRQKLANNFKSLFLMLHRKRGDYLSRSVLEIFEEEHAFPNLNITIEKDLVLHYPAAYFFYVNKDNKKLADALTEGLKIAVADGSFDEIFNRYFSEQIHRAHLSTRRIIDIPYTPPKSLDQSIPDFWYKPEKAEAL
jgi:hypothetical protein